MDKMNNIKYEFSNHSLFTLKDVTEFVFNGIISSQNQFTTLSHILELPLYYYAEKSLDGLVFIPRSQSSIESLLELQKELNENPKFSSNLFEKLEKPNFEKSSLSPSEKTLIYLMKHFASFSGFEYPNDFDFNLLLYAFEMSHKKVYPMQFQQLIESKLSSADIFRTWQHNKMISYLDSDFLQFQKDRKVLFEKNEKKYVFVQEKKKRKFENFLIVPETASLANRKDFGDLPAYSIDSETAHEIDDAISIERKNGFDWIHVHIADPISHLPSSKKDLFQLAMKRVSSLYLAEGLIPIFPPSMKKASLDYETDYHRTLTFSFSLDKTGTLLDYKIQPSIIRNIKKLDYDSVDSLLYKSKDDPFLFKKYINDNPGWETEAKRIKEIDYSEHILKDLKKLLDYSILLSTNGIENSNRFEIFGFQQNVKLNPNDRLFPFVESKHMTPPSIHLELEISNTPSRRLISELMIMAGYVAARYAKERNLPFLYKAMPQITHNFDYIDTINEMRKKKHPVNGLLSVPDSLEILSYLGPSRTTPEPLSHSILDLDCYAQVTSPLRRASDLFNHSVLHHHFNNDKQMIKGQDLGRIANYINYKTRKGKILMRQNQKFWIQQWLLSAVNPNEIDGWIIKKSSYKNFKRVFIKQFGVFGLVDTTSDEGWIRVCFKKNEDYNTIEWHQSLQ